MLLQSWNLKKLTVAPPSGFKDMRQKLIYRKIGDQKGVCKAKT